MFLLYGYTTGGSAVHILVYCPNQDLGQLGLYCMLIFRRSRNRRWVVQCIINHVLEQRGLVLVFYVWIEGLKAESLQIERQTHPFTPPLQIVVHFLERSRGTLRVANLDKLNADLMFWPFGTFQVLRVLEDHGLWVVGRFAVGQDDENDRFGRVDRPAEEPSGLFELSPIFVEQLL